MPNKSLMHQHEQKMKTNEKRKKGERQEKERVEKEEPSTGHRRLRYDFYKEAVVWGPYPPHNRVQMEVDPCLKPRRTVHQTLMKNFCEEISVHPESSHYGLNNDYTFQNSVSERNSSSQQPPLTSGLMNQPTPYTYNAAPKNLSSFSPSLHWPKTSDCTMVPPSVPEMGISSQQRIPIFQLMHGQIPVAHHPPMNNIDMVSPPEISDCVMVPPSVPMMGTSSQQQALLFQHRQIPVGHHPPMKNPDMVSPSATTMGVLSNKQLQV
ncbi:hypothetical protein NE237_014075 [Protea cynaroides]|uniref:Uncharacterized protein n=1 Tax=Protea cynaroides TaxID=273540 RepID=A0A9Q0GZW6_9MAGN|nr:hypothetical protein NE237_014075 [Protea cynaroides]